jgi:hypothetical protein
MEHRTPRGIGAGWVTHFWLASAGRYSSMIIMRGLGKTVINELIHSRMGAAKLAHYSIILCAALINILTRVQVVCILAIFCRMHIESI